MRRLAEQEMEPEQIKLADPVRALKSALRGLAEVKAPSDAEEPILAPSVRAALFSWLIEIRAQDELEKAKLKPRNSALFFGPPGTGKTTLAHHLAARLGIPLVIVGSENIISSGWGEAERNLAKLFDCLVIADTPSVLFVDEVEGIGGSRDKNTFGGADNARTQLLGVLLRKMETYGGYVVAATNRPGDIDQALWRRFHLQISIDLPGADERFSILKRYGLPFQFTDDDLDLLVDLTDGASPALLRGLMEGVKRSLILGSRINLRIDDPVVVFERVLASIKPPPDIEDVPLWRSRASVKELSRMTWPPTQEGEG